MKITQRITYLAHKLLAAYADPLVAEQSAWWIVEFVTQQNKTRLLTHQHDFTPSQEQRIQEIVHSIIHDKKPLQYIIGSVPFGDVDILVEPPILIPRPETEEWCLKLIDQLRAVGRQPITILDLCCGSGCIAIALAHALPHATIYAVDISPQAVALTQKNITHNNINNITVVQSDLFAQLQSKKFDVIVSNPPYIAESEWRSLDESVTAWEDRNALIAADHGVAIIHEIIRQAPAHLHVNTLLEKYLVPQLIIEIGYQQGDKVKKIMEDAGYHHVMVHKDLEGKDRTVSGRIGDVAMETTHSSGNDHNP